MPVIGVSAVPFAVEELVLHSGKLNTLSQRAGDVGGKARALLTSIQETKDQASACTRQRAGPAVRKGTYQRRIMGLERLLSIPTT